MGSDGLIGETWHIMSGQEEIFIAGNPVTIVPVPKGSLRKAGREAVAGFSFHQAVFMGKSLLLLQPKTAVKLMPKQYKALADQLIRIFGIPVVFRFDRLMAWARNRMVSRGVYFVSGNTYAYLPDFLHNSKTGAPVKTGAFIPPAQQLVLWQLQKSSVDGLTMREIGALTGIGYISLSRGVRQLEKLGFIEVTLSEKHEKVLHFLLGGHDLFDKSLSLMKSPLRTVVYTDSEEVKSLPICGYNALSRFSEGLGVAEEESWAISESNLYAHPEILQDKTGDGGAYRLEVWRYRPLAIDGCVDPVSLCLSFRDSADKRVQRAVEDIIERLW